MNTRTSTWLARALAGCMAAGCGSSTTSATDGPAAAANAGAIDGLTTRNERVYRFFDNGGAQSRVERTVRSNGSETMWSETRLVRTSAAPDLESPARAGGILREYAELDASGRLVYADVSLRDVTGVARRMILDPQHHAVLIRGTTGPARLVHGATTGAPWIYAPMTATVTPVTAWIARRAAEIAPEVQVFDAASGGSQGLMSDQLVFQDGRETLVVLGDRAVSADDEFITSMPLGTLDSPAAFTAGETLGQTSRFVGWAG